MLIGDAAGYNNPIIGQGLSLAMRDAGVMSLVYSDLWARFGPDAAAARAAALGRIFSAAALAAMFLSTVTGLEDLPADVLTDEFRADLTGAVAVDAS